tara:strand:+ start:823 stop:1452 length:630 start_codon:yes stop_codon:yes gene_type:complete
MTKQPLQYQTIKQIIERQTDKRAKLFLAMQYALASRCGELLPYQHYKTNKQTHQLELAHESFGLKKENIYKTKGVWVCEIPNFKNSNQTFKKPFIIPEEEFIFQPFIEWYESDQKHFSDVRERMYRIIVSSCLPFDNASHILRHSRATHLSEIFGFSAYEIKDFLGHANLQTSSVYVHTDLTRMAEKMKSNILSMREVGNNEKVEYEEA